MRQGAARTASERRARSTAASFGTFSAPHDVVGVQAAKERLMSRTVLAVLAVLLSASALAGCGAEPTPDAADAPRSRDTVLARVGASLVAVDGRTGHAEHRLT